MIYCGPMTSLNDRITFWSLVDGTGSIIENNLKTIDLSSSTFESVAVVNFGGNGRSIA